MSFENGVMVARNVNFSLDDPTPHPGIITADGELLIGAAVAPHLRAGTLTSGDGSITVTVGAGTLDLSVAGGTTTGKTITGDSGGALSPTAGNWNILGTSAQGLSFAGAGSTLTGTVADATTSQKGVSALATSAETIAGTDADKNVTAAGLAAKLGVQTNHGVLVGAGTSSAITALAVGADHSLLLGATGADPSFSTTGTPYVTSISFDAGTNSLSTYAVNTWTPTLVGESTAGTTTYTLQQGLYIKIGRLVWIYFDVGISSATGTGNVNIANLPFAINTGSPNGAMLISVAAGWAWPAGTTQLILSGRGGTSTIRIAGIGSGIGSASLQMSNNAATIRGSLIYDAAT